LLASADALAVASCSNGPVTSPHLLTPRFLAPSMAPHERFYAIDGQYGAWKLIAITGHRSPTVGLPLSVFVTQRFPDMSFS
jgi:hypothetical protein